IRRTAWRTSQEQPASRVSHRRADGDTHPRLPTRSDERYDDRVCRESYSDGPWLRCGGRPPRMAGAPPRACPIYAVRTGVGRINSPRQLAGWRKYLGQISLRISEKIGARI